MPLYTYICRVCGDTHEHLVRLADKDSLQPCYLISCKGMAERRGLETFSMGQPEYQMAGILADGTHVPGHFGKDARRDKFKRRKR